VRTKRKKERKKTFISKPVSSFVCIYVRERQWQPENGIEKVRKMKKKTAQRSERKIEKLKKLANLRNYAQH
jgi:hypothetical protein